eukprot:6197311-Pleurochrysis_carterae.AAC.2
MDELMHFPVSGICGYACGTPCRGAHESFRPLPCKTPGTGGSAALFSLHTGGTGREAKTTVRSAMDASRAVLIKSAGRRRGVMVQIDGASPLRLLNIPNHHANAPVVEKRYLQ